MSLINDALRRASQNAAESAPLPAPAAVPQGPPPLQPAEPASGSPWLPLVGLGIGLLAVVGLLGLGGWFAWKAIASSKTPTLTASAKEARPVQPISAASPAVAAGVAVAAPVGQAVSESPAAKEASVTKPETSTLATPAPVVPPPVQQVVKWPALKLQGIYYRPPKSSVMINNKTLFMEEELQGVRVVEIGPQLAKVTLGGQTNTLYLR